MVGSKSMQGSFWWLHDHVFKSDVTPHRAVIHLETDAVSRLLVRT
jgi:hypothetical protein